MTGGWNDPQASMKKIKEEIMKEPNIPEDTKKYWNEMEGEKLLKRVQNKTKEFSNGTQAQAFWKIPFINKDIIPNEEEFKDLVKGVEQQQRSNDFFERQWSLITLLYVSMGGQRREVLSYFTLDGRFFISFPFGPSKSTFWYFRASPSAWNSRRVDLWSERNW